MTETGNPVIDNLVTMVSNRTADTQTNSLLDPQIRETLRMNAFVIDALVYEINRKNETIHALLKPYQKK